MPLVRSTTCLRERVMNRGWMKSPQSSGRRETSEHTKWVHRVTNPLRAYASDGKKAVPSAWVSVPPTRSAAEAGAPSAMKTDVKPSVSVPSSSLPPRAETPASKVPVTPDTTRIPRATRPLSSPEFVAPIEEEPETVPVPPVEKPEAKSEPLPPPVAPIPEEKAAPAVEPPAPAKIPEVTVPEPKKPKIG